MEAPAAASVAGVSGPRRSQRGAAAAAAAVISQLVKQEQLPSDLEPSGVRDDPESATAAGGLPAGGSSEPTGSDVTTESTDAAECVGRRRRCAVCGLPAADQVWVGVGGRRLTVALLPFTTDSSAFCRPCARLVSAVAVARARIRRLEMTLRSRRRAGDRRRQRLYRPRPCRTRSTTPSRTYRIRVPAPPRRPGETSEDSRPVSEHELNRTPDLLNSDVKSAQQPTQQEDDRERSARIDEDLDDPRGADESLESSAAAPATTARSKPHHRAQAVSKQCATCGKQLRSARALRDHQNLHSGARPYGCGQCERRFPSKAALRQHAGVHSGKWACDLCDKVYSTEPALSTHRSYRHFPERLTSHVCPVCGKQFLGRKPYTKHMGTHAAERRQLPCSQPGCHSTFRSESALRVHEAKHAGRRFACDQCPALFFSNASLLQHMVGHGSVEARFACPQCPRRFMYRSVLRSHVRSVHALSRDCVCERCGATFATTYALNSHQATHTEGRPHVCQCCPAAFKSKQLLARHVRNVHLQQKQHPCPQCDKSFHTPYHLRVHLRCHTGERPFACPRCPKRFAQRAHVRSHLHVHRQGRADGSEQPHLAAAPAVSTWSPCLPFLS